LITGESSVTAQQAPETEQKGMRGTIRITHLGVRVRDLEGAVMIGELLEAASETTEIVYVADKVPSNIKYARRLGKKPWRIVVFRDPDDVIIELVER
jgi:catechol 2,3-dioxygenase-like lactoylglutathione lyase family enzyme